MQLLALGLDELACCCENRQMSGCAAQEGVIMGVAHRSEVSRISSDMKNNQQQGELFVSVVCYFEPRAKQTFAGAKLMVVQHMHALQPSRASL